MNTNYAAPLYNVQSFDLPSQCPRAPKKRAQVYQSEVGVSYQATNLQDQGYLKKNFFSSLCYNKPAVTIFIFDWRDWARFHPEDEEFEWRVHEQLILDQIRAHSETW